MSYFLNALKERVLSPPKCIVIDFSPALKKGCLTTYPDAIVAHDYFHSAQLLNRGLEKELIRRKRVNLDQIIRAHHKFRFVSLTAENTGTIPSYHTTIPFLQQMWEIFGELWTLRSEPNLQHFEAKWRQRSHTYHQMPERGVKTLGIEMSHLEPLRGFTVKGRDRCIAQLRTIWRRVIRDYRTMVEQKHHDFRTAKYIVLKNPANMSPTDHRLLRTALQTFPWLREVREVVQKFHYQFKATPPNYRSLSFLTPLLVDDAHPMLKSAILTLQTEEAGIFAFRRLWAEYPEYRQNIAIRSNREDLNCKVNKLVRNQYGFRQLRGSRIRLSQIWQASVIFSRRLIAQENL